MEWTSHLRWNEINLTTNPRRKLPESYQRCLVLRSPGGRRQLAIGTYKANERVFSTPVQDIPIENGMLWLPVDAVKAERRNV